MRRSTLKIRSDGLGPCTSRSSLSAADFASDSALVLAGAAVYEEDVEVARVGELAPAEPAEPDYAERNLGFCGRSQLRGSPRRRR